MKKPIRVAVTGAAGQLGYSLVFRIANGAMLGREQPVILQLLEIPQALKALEGLVMEIDDCALPLLAGMIQTDDPDTAFGDAEVAILVGAAPRKKGMERSDLLASNGAIFKTQGEALARSARTDVKVLVVGNPANTNCLITMRNAPGLEPDQFSAMTRLDHNRSKSLLAKRLGCHVNDIRHMTVWGNHSVTQYPDLFNCTVKGRRAADLVNDQEWLESTFIPHVSNRGKEILEARGFSSAASAANAALEHMRDWFLGTPENDWVSMAVRSDGSYGVPEGLIYSYPVTCRYGHWSIVQGLEINEYSRRKMDETARELEEERNAVRELGLI